MTWDLSSYFPEFNGPEMRHFKEELRADVDSLKQRAGALANLSNETAAEWEGIVLRHEDLSRRMSHLSSYISCLASSDARNEEYLREEVALVRTRAEFAKVKIELLRAFKLVFDETFAALLSRPALAGAEHYLNRLREEARRSMAPEKEVLATDVGVDGIQAWGRVYDAVWSKLRFVMAFPDGRDDRLPMSQRRSLMDNPDRRV